MTRGRRVTVDADVSGRDVLRHVVGREVKVMASYESFVDEGLTPEGVHQLRVSARRLRSELRAMREVLSRESWGRLDGDLRWLGATLSHLRDLQVLGELFDAQTYSDPSLRGVITTALERRRDRRHRDAMAVLESARYRKLVRRLDHRARHPGLGHVGDLPAVELFTPALHAAACRFLAEVGDPSWRRSDEDLHRVRIASKKCRYGFEVATLFWGQPARDIVTSLEGIQTVLGHVNDRVVAVAFLNTLELPGGVDLDLRRALRAQIIDLRPQWTSYFATARHDMTDLFSGREKVEARRT